MTRREAREQALSLIFEMNFNDNTVEDMVDNAMLFRDETIDDYAVRIAQQVRLHTENLLELIGKNSTRWKVNRLPRVSLSILELAMVELVYIKDVPVGAVINEAVELAKKYAGEEDASYINGVLGGYVRSLDAAPVDIPTEVSMDTVAESPVEASVEAQEEVPEETTQETSVEVPMDTAAEATEEKKE